MRRVKAGLACRSSSQCTHARARSHSLKTWARLLYTLQGPLPLVPFHSFFSTCHALARLADRVCAPCRDDLVFDPDCGCGCGYVNDFAFDRAHHVDWMMTTRRMRRRNGHETRCVDRLISSVDCDCVNENDCDVLSRIVDHFHSLSPFPSHVHALDLADSVGRVVLASNHLHRARLRPHPHHHRLSWLIRPLYGTISSRMCRCASNTTQHRFEFTARAAGS